MTKYVVRKCVDLMSEHSKDKTFYQDPRRAFIKKLKSTTENISDAMNECAILRKLQNHENVIELKQTYVDKSKIYVVYEDMLLDLFTLNSEIALSTEDTMFVFRDIVEGLAHIHQMGFIHCDLKLENIAVSYGHRVKILDFDLARPHGGVYRDIIGTRVYQAPEMRNKSGWDGAIDIFSLGVVLFEIRTGYNCMDDNDQLAPCVAYAHEVMELYLAMTKSNPRERIGCGNDTGIICFDEIRAAIPTHTMSDEMKKHITLFEQKILSVRRKNPITLTIPLDSPLDPTRSISLL